MLTTPVSLLNLLSIILYSTPARFSFFEIFRFEIIDINHSHLNQLGLSTSIFIEGDKFIEIFNT